MNQESPHPEVWSKALSGMKCPSKRTSVFLITLITILINISVGCAPITTVREDGSTVRHHLGYVRIIEPPTVGTDEQFNVSEVKTIGIRIERGVGVGYFYERYEYIPLDCRLVIRVANKEQLDNVLKTLSPIVKEGLCVTVSP